MKNAPLTTPTPHPKWESESLLLLGELLSAAKKFACYVVHFSSLGEIERGIGNIGDIYESEDGGTEKTGEGRDKREERVERREDGGVRR